MRLALASAILLMSGPTWAAEIAGPRAVACIDRSVFERMFRVDGAGDREATISLMEQAMRAGRCSPVRPGMAVRIEEREDRYVCVARMGSTAPCVWMLARDVNP